MGRKGQPEEKVEYRRKLTKRGEGRMKSKEDEEEEERMEEEW